MSKQGVGDREKGRGIVDRGNCSLPFSLSRFSPSPPPPAPFAPTSQVSAITDSRFPIAVGDSHL